MLVTKIIHYIIKITKNRVVQDFWFSAYTIFKVYTVIHIMIDLSHYFSTIFLLHSYLHFHFVLNTSNTIVLRHLIISSNSFIILFTD